MKLSALAMIAFTAAAALAMISAPARAELAFHGVEAVMNDDLSSHMKVTLEFSGQVSAIEYATSFPITSLKTSGNFGPVVCDSTIRGVGSLIRCSLSGIAPGKDTLYLEFDTRRAVNFSYGRYHFTVEFASSLPSDKFSMVARLPESATLASFPANQSYSPGYGDTTTDGRRIIVTWEGSGISADQPMEFDVDYNLPPIKGSVTRYIVLGAGILVLAVIAAALFYTRRASKVNKTKVIASVLNADEKRVVDILAAGGGSALQKQIVKDSGFSKAKVSRVVKSLLNRKVVKIEPVSGRENRVLLADDRKNKKKEEPNETSKQLGAVEESAKEDEWV